MSNPFFSILMPLYNHADYVGLAIESVLAQTEPDFELVICNDGSTDHSAEVVRQYRDQRIRYIEKQNGGTVSALNAALLLSRGEYICWLSSDDLYQAEKLAVHRRFHEQQQSAVSIAPYGLIKGKSLYSAGQRVYKGRERLIPFISMNYVNGLSICVARETYAKAGLFNPTFKYAHDVERWLSIFQYEEPSYLLGDSLSFTRLGTGHLANYNSDLNGFLDVLKINVFVAASGLEGFLPFEFRENRSDLEWLLGNLLSNSTNPESNIFYRFGMPTLFLKAAANFVKKFGFAADVGSTYAPMIAAAEERDQFVAFCHSDDTELSQTDFYRHLDLLIASTNVDQKIKDTIVFYKKTTLS